MEYRALFDTIKGKKRPTPKPPTLTGEYNTITTKYERMIEKQNNPQWIKENEDIFTFITCHDPIKMEEMVKNGSIKNIDLVALIDFKSNVARIKGLTALLYNSRFGTYEAMDWLLSKNPLPNVNFKDDYGNTPLISVVKSGEPIDIKVKKINLLLRYGADKTLTNEDDDTPLSLAKYRNQKEIIDLLNQDGGRRKTKRRKSRRQRKSKRRKSRKY